MLEQNHHDSGRVSSKSLPKFSAFLFESGQAAIKFGVSVVTHSNGKVISDHTQ
jgi:hypothetical protein